MDVCRFSQSFLNIYNYKGVLIWEKTHMYGLGKQHSQTQLALYGVVSMVLNTDMWSDLLTVNQNVLFSLSDLSHKELQFYC